MGKTQNIIQTYQSGSFTCDVKASKSEDIILFAKTAAFAVSFLTSLPMTFMGCLLGSTIKAEAKGEDRIRFIAYAHIYTTALTLFTGSPAIALGNAFLVTFLH